MSRPPLRLIVGCAGKPFDWAGATCTRTLWRDGTLFECVKFKGTTAGFNEEDLERFIAKFPIEALL